MSGTAASGGMVDTQQMLMLQLDFHCYQTGLADVHVEISFANQYYPCDFAFTYECGMGSSGGDDKSDPLSVGDPNPEAFFKFSFSAHAVLHAVFKRDLYGRCSSWSCSSFLSRFAYLAARTTIRCSRNGGRTSCQASSTSTQLASFCRLSPRTARLTHTRVAGGAQQPRPRAIRRFSAHGPGLVARGLVLCGSGMLQQSGTGLNLPFLGYAIGCCADKSALSTPSSLLSKG